MTWTLQRRAEEQLHLMLESVPTGIVIIDRAGVITLVNAQSEHLFGYTRAELIGLSVDKLVPERFRADHPEHRARYFADPHTRHMGGGRDLYGLRKDGREVPIEIGLNPLKTPDGDFVFASVIDISARKEMEDALRRVHTELEARIRERTLELQDANISLRDSEQRMRLATEATEVGIWEWNVITNRIRWDAQMFRLYGIPPTPEGVVDYTDWIGTVAPEDLRQQEETLQDTVRRQGSSLREFRIRRRKDGEWRVIQAVDTVRTGATGQTEWVVGTNLDITARRRAETALQQAHDDLESKVVKRTDELKQAKEQAETADRIKSAFLATMSHELRTPLNSIIGFTGIILQGLAGPLNPEQSKQLEMVRGSARHLLALINDVLDISKIEAGQVTVSCELFDLRASIDKVIGVVAPLAAKKQLALSSDLAEALKQANADQRRFEQILLNLLSNAIKFTERGSVTLQVSLTTKKDSNGSALPSMIHVNVTDTGMGIKPEDLATLFQPFRQLDTGLSRNHEGTGLGLAICRRLVELMGGEIHATSKLGVGSTFTFALPVVGKVK